MNVEEKLKRASFVERIYNQDDPEYLETGDQEIILLADALKIVKEAGNLLQQQRNLIVVELLEKYDFKLKEIRELLHSRMQPGELALARALILRIRENLNEAKKANNEHTDK